MKTVYLDLDGVMADFDAAFPARFGVSHIEMEKKEMWRHIATDPQFFRNLPPMPGALEAWGSWLQWHNPIILTACSVSHFESVAQQKREWVRHHLGRGVQMVPVTSGEFKPLVMREVGDILIDDWSKNTNAWAAAGGTAIKHEHDWAATEREFREVFFRV